MNCTTVHCTSETVKYACQHECSVHQERHNRTTYETWIRYFCADLNRIVRTSSRMMTNQVTQAIRTNSKNTALTLLLLEHLDDHWCSAVREAGTVSSLEHSADNSLHDLLVPLEHFNLIPHVDDKALSLARWSYIRHGDESDRHRHINVPR